MSDELNRAAPAAAQLDAELPPIEYDKDMDRTYIPLPGGWEIQTKGKGSTFRIAHASSDTRWLVLDEKLHEPLEAMARDTRNLMAQYAERIRLLDHEAITQKLANQVLRDRVAFLESERNLMEANRRAHLDGRTASPIQNVAAPETSETSIVQDVADVFRGCGFEVRDELGAGHQFAVCGSLDSAAILLETVMTGQKIGGVERFHWSRKGMELHPDGFYMHYRASDDIGSIDGRTAGTAPAEAGYFYTFTKPEGWINLQNPGQSWQEWTREQGAPTTKGWKVFGNAAAPSPGMEDAK